MDDSRIIQLFWERSDAAVCETDKRYRAYCYTIAHNVLGNKEDAEECLNDAYLALWNSIPPNRPTSLTAYLGKITRNLALKRLRHNTAKRRSSNADLAYAELEHCIPSTAAEPQQALESAELAKHINSFLKGLTEKERGLFVGRYWYCYSIKQLSTGTGNSVASVKVTLKRTRDKLKAYLEKEDIKL